MALVATPLALTAPASANPAGTGLVIDEVYGGGGNTGATYKSDFVELYNPTAADISLTGLSLQYRSATGTGTANTTVVPLSGSVPAHGHWLLQAATGSGGTTDLPTPDQTGTVPAMGATGGQIFLVDGTTAVDPGAGAVVANASLLDFVGWGTTSGGTVASSYETARGATTSNTTSLARKVVGADANDNSADFATGAPGPQNSGVTPPPADPPVDKTIAEIQGDGSASPLEGKAVVTRGVVTAAYPTGGLNGFNIQTPGTGGAVDLDTHTASDGIFVYLGSAAPTAYPAVGDYVEVTGTAKENFDLTEITAKPADVKPASGTVTAPEPAQVVWPSSTAKRESLEGMLVAPQGAYTVTDNYSANRYGEIGLARGTQTLRQPTDVARPGAGATAVANANAAKAVLLDDGATTDFLPTDPAKAANQDIALPYLTKTNPVRVGAGVTFEKPVVVDYQFSKYRFQPTAQVTGDGSDVVTFDNTRTAHPEPVGGDLKIASFNVLNYFTDTGDEVNGDGDATLDCTSYVDRDENPITVRGQVTDEPTCDARGAWNDANLSRQQAKIVEAINALGADVLSLEEIENSAKFGHPRDESLNTLVSALNAEAGSEVWAAAPSPAYRPTLAEEDAIRTAFIYKKAKVETVGASQILTGSAAFANAREPLAQVFRPLGGKLNQQFVAIVNHFKSKGSGSGTDADQGDGQGASNASRVAQAKALVSFVKDVADSSNTKQVFLTGDFNSYTKEDPMQVLYDAGFSDIGSTLTDESTYLFDGVVGSLDHVLANSAALRQVTGADVWNINSVESPAFEYSRYNYNATDLYTADQFRSSDHDPLVVGFDTPGANKDVTVNLLNINDFHGRIDGNTVGWAATIEKLRQAAGPDSASALLSAGDNIGASLFASSSDGDLPTIDVLNKLELKSSVGNHEFDKGYQDLVTRVADATDWNYLGANVFKADGSRALQPYDVVTVNGVRVGVIGAVTQETPSLVTPSGIEGLQFKNPVTSVNEVADQLKDGDPDNGEADVVVAEYHEGAPEGTPDGATLDKELATSPVFKEIVTQTSSKVAAIFTAHTHKQYAWDAPVPGVTGKTRPVVQTGSYGETIGRVTFTVDADTKAVSSYTTGLTPRLTVSDLNGDKKTDGADQTIFDDSVVAAYGQRVADVRTIVSAAVAKASVAGSPKVGQIGHDITTAYTSGSNAGGTYTVPDPKVGRDDRTSESTLGDTVANMLRDTMAPSRYGSAEIGIVNPGGLRAELLYAGTNNPATDVDGAVTTGEAVSVLPFANNLFTVRLTGAQLKQVLEQQWQTNADGTIPSRSFLQLGLSDNVQTTLDPSKPMGSRVTSVRIDGQPLDLARTYTVGTFSFLATGGDNFRAFKQGTATDTGLVDTDGWFAYLGNHQTPALEPSFARRQVYGAGFPESVGAGDAVSFSLTKLDLTSLGAPANTTVDVAMKTGTTERALGTYPVTAGGATVSFTAPASIPAGSTFVVTARPSGTTVVMPATATANPAADTTTTATVTPSRVVVRATKPTLTATVKTAGGAPVGGGTVNVYENGRNLGTAAVANGTATVKLPAFTTTGSHDLSVEYTGVADTTKDSSTTVHVAVVKAKPTTKVSVVPRTVHRRTHPRLTITMTAPGQTVTGYVAVRAKDRRVALARLVHGTARVTLPTYRATGVKAVVVRYLGWSLADATRTTTRFRVVR
jgi:5'-nucleotidase